MPEKVIQSLYSQIELKSNNCSVKELCNIYGVSRNGYYKYLKRKGLLNQDEKQQLELDIYGSEIHSHYPTMGYRSIRDRLLLETGWIVSDISVWKSIKRLNIKGYIRKAQYPQQYRNEHNRYANILNRDFKVNKPLEKILYLLSIPITDTSVIPNKKQTRYSILSAFLFNPTPTCFPDRYPCAASLYQFH